MLLQQLTKINGKKFGVNIAKNIASNEHKTTGLQDHGTRGPQDKRSALPSDAPFGIDRAIDLNMLVV